MTRRLPHSFLAVLAALLFAAASPLAAQTTEPAETAPAATEPAETEVGERVERAEEGTLSGNVVLLDADNLILETAEGDRAFSIRDDSTLPAELRDAADWASYRGVPVRVTFAPGAEGELRVVRQLTLVSDTAVSDDLAVSEETAVAETTPAETAETTADTPERPFTTNTDLGDQTDVVEPREIEPAAGERVALDVDGDDAEVDSETTAAGFTADDDELPPAADTMASLPATASPLPWLALIGTLALGAAFLLGQLERRRRRLAVDTIRR